MSHPADCGDRGTILAPAPSVLVDIIRELDPTVDERPDQPFPFLTGPCVKESFLKHRELVLRLERAAVEPLATAIRGRRDCMQLVADVLEAAFARDGLPRKKRSIDTEAEHAELTEAVKHVLAIRLCERVTLEEVSRAVDTSPFHLARVFQRQTGVPIHRYLARLRLRTAIERLEQGARDLAALALELNFSSHSHFTDAFRREFGCTPSDVRKNRPGCAKVRRSKKRPQQAAQMSKNLKA